MWFFLRSKVFSGQKHYKSNLLAGSIVAVSDRVGFALFGLSCGFDRFMSARVASLVGGGAGCGGGFGAGWGDRIFWGAE